MTWWSWMVLGALLLGAEMFAIDAQFYLVFIGLSAIIVGTLDVVGVPMPEWLQWLVFSALALMSMFTFRSTLYNKIRGGAPGFNEGLEGEYVVVSEELAPGQQCRSTFRGTEWTVVNDGADTIAAGTRTLVTGTESLTLHVNGVAE